MYRMVNYAARISKKISKQPFKTRQGKYSEIVKRTLKLEENNPHIPAGEDKIRDILNNVNKTRSGIHTISTENLIEMRTRLNGEMPYRMEFMPDASHGDFIATIHKAIRLIDEELARREGYGHNEFGGGKKRKTKRRKNKKNRKSIKNKSH